MREKQNEEIDIRGERCIQMQRQYTISRENERERDRLEERKYFVKTETWIETVQRFVHISDNFYKRNTNTYRNWTNEKKKMSKDE